MLRFTKSNLLPLLLACFLAPAIAVADVRDSTGLFSQNAVHQANEMIDQIRKQSGRDVIVEVFAQIPADLKGQYKADQKAAFFSNWMHNRAGQLNVNGIYILICRDPNYLEIGVGAKTQQHDFTPNDRNQLRDLMLGRLKNKQFDQGLIDGVRFIQKTMQSNLGQSAQRGTNRNILYYGANNRSSLWWGWWVVIGVGAFLILLWIISAVTARRSYPYAGYGGYPGAPGRGPMTGGGVAYPPGGYYPPTTGGGFGRSLLGGLLGGAMGGWLYDRFRGSQGPMMGGSSMPPTENPPDQSMQSDQGQGFEGTGGSFGDGGDQGGGDFGGGSADSGGDFGGGDSGGGGGDDAGGSF